jgi:hypothetical protein
MVAVARLKPPHRTPPNEEHVHVSVRGRRKGKLRLLTRKNIDGRGRAVQIFDAVAHGIAADLGGAEHLTTVQKHLVEAFAGCALHITDLNARLMLGEEIDLLAHTSAINALVKLASRIGSDRVARNVTPSLQQYLRERAHDMPEAAE